MRERQTLQGQLLRGLKQRHESINPSSFYEERVRLILDELRSEGKIVNFRQTDQNSEEDAKGIDFWIITTDGTEIPLQVTSDRNLAKKRRKKHPEIPVVHSLRRRPCKSRGKFLWYSTEELKEQILAIVEANWAMESTSNQKQVQTKEAKKH